MRIDPETSSPWMTEFHKQLVRGKHVLLYGNVVDQFLLNGEYLPLHAFLGKYLRDDRYDIIGRYDTVDGLQFLDPAMERLFEEALRSSLGGEAVASQTALPAASARPREVPRAATSLIAGLRAPDQAFTAIRTVLSQSQQAAAMVINFSDSLTGDPERLSEGERHLLIQLMKSIHNAAYQRSGPLAGRPNALVLVAGQLGKVPASLYHDNPLLALVQIPRPTWKERQGFLCSFAKNFHGGDQLKPNESAATARAFADLTDGLTAWDLEALRRTSRAEQINLATPKALVDYYKYGRRDDPWEKLDGDRIRTASQRIEQRVIGQSQAVRAVVRMLASARVGISLSESSAKAGKPKGMFFFVGPTGVGKTELAKALAELVFGDDAAFARFDMSEYAEQHAAEKLTGSPPGFVGYEEGGHLTNRVREKPFSLLLFDEIEKAHGRVMDKFLQVLEDGRLTDGKGQTSFFSQTVIIFTSNIGSDTLNLLQAPAQQLPEYKEVRAHYLAAVQAHFTRPPSQGGLGRPELLNRLGDNVLVFDLLRPQYIDGICQKFMSALVSSAREKCGLELQFPDDGLLRLIRGEMAEGDNALFGGRRVKSLLETWLEKPLNQWIFLEAPPRGSSLRITADDKGKQVLINGRPTP